MESIEELKGQDLELIIDKLTTFGLELGKNILIALVIYFVGRWLIRLVNKMVAGMMDKRKVDPAVKSFVGSIVNVVMLIMLFVIVVGTLGVQTTSFAEIGRAHV